MVIKLYRLSFFGIIEPKSYNENVLDFQEYSHAMVLIVMKWELYGFFMKKVIYL